MTRTAEQIAASLCEAAARNVMNGCFSHDLAQLGLCWFRAAHIDYNSNPPKQRPSRWEWRPRGLAVRAVLEGKSDG